MRVRDVQHAERLRARRQDGDLEPAKSEPVPLDHGGIADAGGTESADDREEGSQFHSTMVP
jgi:hypothetical protein